MNKYAAITAIAMFALGAVAGHSMTGQIQPAVAAKSEPVSAFELMRTANLSPETGDQEICRQLVMCD